MGTPQDTKETRRRLASAVRREAFESYVRRGHVPAGYGHLAEIAADEGKFLDFGRALSVTSRPEGRPTAFYVWRTAGDERVRSAHAARSQSIFAWSDLLPFGHVGSEPNCRCWPEPYYGNPAIPDALLSLTRERRVDTAGTEPWASIETLTRPDGSLAESLVLTREGTGIRSSFAGREVAHVVTAPRERVVRVEQRNGIQSIYVDTDPAPVQQTTWSAPGPIVRRTRPRSAFLLNRNPLGTPFTEGPITPAEPGPGLAGGGGDPGTVLAVALGLLALYNQQQSDPASMGAGTGGVTAIAFKAWEYDSQVGGNSLPIPVAVGSLTEEQIRQSCMRLPDVQEWTNSAAAQFEPQRSTMSRQQLGTAIHKRIKDIITGLKHLAPALYKDVFVELSLSNTPDEPVFYGQEGSIRADVIEDRREEIGAVCFYDIKTGKGGLTWKRVVQMAEIVARNFGPVIYYIVEVRPTTLYPPRGR